MATILNCAQCGGDLAPGDGFCAHCGHVCRCPECGTSVAPGSTLCPACHAAIDPAAPGIPFPLGPPDHAAAWTDLVERLRRATEGEFEIGRELGRGGMAAVFLAHELSLDRQVAIKVMSPGLFMGEGMVDRFRHEAITIAHLHHPNIVSVYSVRQAEGLHFFIMRYVQGRSLEQVIQQAGKLPLPVVRSILHQVGSALTYAHRRRVVHRDIKPGNILIDGDGNAIVTDFGIAKAAESPSKTMTGALVGTPAYMSPEQCRGAEVSGASDQYSLGAVAYEMLTGVPPFSGSTFTVLQAHVERTPEPLAGRLADCPPEVEAAVLRMLAKDPAARWPLVADAMAALGAEPLADADPLRLELTQLTVSSAAPAPAADTTSTGRPTRTRPSGAVPAGAVAGIAILPPPAGLEIGDSFVLVALVRGPNGTRLPPAAVTWSCDTPGVLKLDSGGGPAVAIGVGSTLLSATCKGARAVLPIAVSPPRADELAIEPPEHGVRAGDEIHLEAIARDKHGRLITRPVSWQTADPGTATVTGNGSLLAQAPGMARISAVLDSVRASIVVPVLPARVAAINLEDRTATVAGDAFTLTATPVDRWGSPLPDRTVLWSSSDVKVAVVTAGGRIHALRPGQTVITASCEGISESLKLAVGATPTAEVPVPTAPVTYRRVRRRRPRRILAAAIGAGLAAGVFWLFGRPEPPPVAAAAALPEPRGYVAYSGGRDSAGPASVAITRRPSRALRPTGTFQLAAEVRGPDGRPVSDAGVVWASRDSTVARVDPRSGWVRAIAPGQAHVVAASGQRLDSIPIVVREPGPRVRPVGTISIAPVDPIRVGESATLHADVRDTQGLAVEDSAVTWHSTNDLVATVDAATGRVSGEAPGTAVVIATGGGISTFIELTVLPTAVARVIVHGVPPLVVGQTMMLSAIPTDADGNALRERPVAWSSSDPGVLEVDSTSGLIAARAPGSAEITATSDGSSGSARITVFARDASDGSSGSRPSGSEAAVLAGVDQCYAALAAKDADRVAKLYQPITQVDQENLKSLRRILRTREWAAIVGERVNGERKVGETAAWQAFGLRLTWRDAAGVRHVSDPTFRADFARRDGAWVMTSCRIVGKPSL